MPEPINQNTVGQVITTTQQAQQIFETQVGLLNNIYSLINSTNSSLGQAMVSTSGEIYRSKIAAWNDDFNDIIRQLNFMATQLGNTWQRAQYNENHSQELAGNLNAGIGFVHPPA